MRRIRSKLGIKLYFDRQAGGYVIKDTWLPLLDLPDEDLATIAWLEQTFDHDSPQHDEVHALLGRLRSYLAPERRAKIERHRTALVMDLVRPDTEMEAAALVDAYAADAHPVLREDFYNSLLAAYTVAEIEQQLKEAGLTHFSVTRPSDRHWLAAGLLPG